MNMPVGKPDMHSRFVSKTANKKIPILGEFELTANCNFKCSFCYLNHEIKNPDLSTEQWKNIFSYASKAGLLFANLTGGELFLRKDFIELYKHLYDLGTRITLFTNGSVISDNVIEVLKKRKPDFIAITIYGHDQDSYASITGNASAFDNVKRNIQKLKESKINVILRTIPIQYIYDRLDAIIQFVKSMDMKLYYFSYVTKPNCFDFQNQRLSPDHLVDFENRIRDAFNYEPAPIRFEEDYKSCVALRASYFINHLGEMQPCALAYEPRRSVLDGDFLETFKSLSKEYLALEKQNPCNNCSLLNQCQTCYARRLNEDGITECASYLKEVAKRRESFYKIADLDIGLQVRYPRYFKDNIDAYKSKEEPKQPYHIRTHYVNEIQLPSETPTYRHSQRLVYETKDQEVIYALDETGHVKEKFTRSNDYHHFDLFFAKDKDEVLEEKEYIFTGIAFLDIACYNGYIPIHGSGIQYNNKGMIISAPSGVGKSTFAKHWMTLYPEASIFNDDKPLIKNKDHEIYVYGTPWAGKDRINRNVTLPLETIVFLERGSENQITTLDAKDKIKYLFRNINRPKDPKVWQTMQEGLSKLVESTTMYLATVINDVSAAEMVHDTLWSE